MTYDQKILIKPYYLLMIIVIFLMLISGCQKSKETTIIIEDQRKYPKPIFGGTNYKDKQVEIFRAMYFGDNYICHMYYMQDMKLNRLSCHILTEQEYDMATYKWVNDSTLHFSLINSQTKVSSTYTCSYAPLSQSVGRISELGPKALVIFGNEIVH
jgi:hypothetical protein